MLHLDFLHVIHADEFGATQLHRKINDIHGSGGRVIFIGIEGSDALNQHRHEEKNRGRLPFRISDVNEESLAETAEKTYRLAYGLPTPLEGPQLLSTTIHNLLQMAVADAHGIPTELIEYAKSSRDLKRTRYEEKSELLKEKYRRSWQSGDTKKALEDYGKYWKHRIEKETYRHAIAAPNLIRTLADYAHEIREAEKEGSEPHVVVVFGGGHAGLDELVKTQLKDAKIAARIHSQIAGMPDTLAYRLMSKKFIERNTVIGKEDLARAFLHDRVEEELTLPRLFEEAGKRLEANPGANVDYVAQRQLNVITSQDTDLHEMIKRAGDLIQKMSHDQVLETLHDKQKRESLVQQAQGI